MAGHEACRREAGTGSVRSESPKGREDRAHSLTVEEFATKAGMQPVVDDEDTRTQAVVMV